MLLAGTRIDQFSERQMLDVRGDRISMIFQEPMSSLNPIYRVGNQIAEALILHQRLTKKQALARALDLLKEVRIPEPEARLEQYPHQLSGGQRQRVMIAMAIANNPEFLIADEPTTALDVTVQAEILKLIRQLQARHDMGVLLITHDLTIVEKVSDSVAVMRSGACGGDERDRRALRRAAPPLHATALRCGAFRPAESGRAEERDRAQDRQGPGRVPIFAGAACSRRQNALLVAVDDVSLALRERRDARHRRRVRLGQDDARQGDPAAASQRRRQRSTGRARGSRRRSKAEMRPFRPNMQVVFQDPFSSLNPRLSVKQIIEEGLIVNRVGGVGRERDERIRAALVDVGLDPNSLNRFPHEFSGGQRQRIAIARALVLDPEFIMLDEPTSALDLSVQGQVIDLLRDLQRKRGLAYLFISHDLKVVRALCHRVIVMSGGKVVETGDTDQIMDAPREDYTKRLVRAALEVEA